MGDRVLIQVVKSVQYQTKRKPVFEKTKVEFSPVAYAHWRGDESPEVVRKLKHRMEGREGDVEYTFARLLQEMIGDDDKNTGFGCWNATKVLDEKDSHGDAGIILIDLTGGGFMCRCLGGYLKVAPDGLPARREE